MSTKTGHTSGSSGTHIESSIWLWDMCPEVGKSVARAGEGIEPLDFRHSKRTR